MNPDAPGGPLDVATLETLARRSETHPLVEDWAFSPDRLSPRRLEIVVDRTQYPDDVESTRIDLRWYEGGDYTVHYVESRAESTWQCRWDRHPKPDASREHFHPPPDASGVEPTSLEVSHHLGVLFAVLDWIEDRLEELHG